MASRGGQVDMGHAALPGSGAQLGPVRPGPAVPAPIEAWSVAFFMAWLSPAHASALGSRVADLTFFYVA